MNEEMAHITRNSMTLVKELVGTVTAALVG